MRCWGWFLGLLLAACGSTNTSVYVNEDAGTTIVEPSPCQPGACGVVSPGLDCGPCPDGQVCGDNGQPHVCGSVCLPATNNSICWTFADGYGVPNYAVAQYSYDCQTDPPIDQDNCVLWSRIDERGQTFAYCCLLPYVGEGGEDAGTD